MTDMLIAKKFHQLPETDRKMVEQLIDLLLSKKTTRQPATALRGGYGSWKGIQIHDDFDAPLEDFKEYIE